MNTADILRFKLKMGTRLTTLRQTLGLKPQEQYLGNDKLNTFRNSTGFYQLFYYFYHYEQIRAAAEYETLSQLDAFPLPISDEDSDLLDIFGEGTPEDPFSVSKTISPEIDRLKLELYKQLHTLARNPEAQNQAVTDFWTKASDKLVVSETNTDRAMGHYIKSRRHLGAMPINFCELKHEPTDPALIKKLAETSSMTYTARKVDGTVDFNRLGLGDDLEVLPPLRTCETPIQITTQTYLFGWIPVPLMGDIQTSLKDQQGVLNQARNLLYEVKTRSIAYFRPFIRGLQATINEWKQTAITLSTPLTEDPAQFPAKPLTKTETVTDRLRNFANGLMTSTPKPIPESKTASSENTWLAGFSKYLEKKPTLTGKPGDDPFVLAQPDVDTTTEVSKPAVGTNWYAGVSKFWEPKPAVQAVPPADNTSTHDGSTVPPKVWL